MMRTRYKNILFAAVVLLLMGGTYSRADVYIYVGKDGVRHFSNTPTTPRYRLFMRSETGDRENAVLSDRYDHLILRAAKDCGLSFSLLKAMIKVESNFNHKAVSRAGAMGLMQIMPDNLAAFNVKDPFDPWENIKGGSGYLKSLMNRFDGKVPLALAAYNAGPTRVENHQGIPPFPETRDYVKRVMQYARVIPEY